MHPKENINRSIVSDITILLFAGIVFATYQYGKNLSPESFLFFIQTVLLWFILKITYRFFPKSKSFVLIGLMVWGLVEALWGLGQLYDYLPAKHVLFKTTGSFLNPGPYGGFIALMFPLTLYYWLVYRYKNKWVAYLFLFAGAVSLMVFPATLSRTAWIAAIAGCAVVLLLDKRITVKLRQFWKRHQKQRVFYSLLLCALLIISGYGIYHLKKDSADGRLFMWKITSLAIQDSPMKGTGLGGFPAAYAKAQIEYFKKDNGSETEKLVAGSPEYAFNEYLQIFLEEGLFGIILFLLLSFLIIKAGIQGKQIGAAGSFVGLSVFAFASYPYQLWQFPVVWVLLGTVCTTGSGNKTARTYRYDLQKTVLSILLLGILCFVSILFASRQKTFFQAKKEWKKLQPLYTMKAYESVTDDYTKLYPRLNHEPKFLFEYGMILNASGQREKADSIFARGLEKSCDPMFYNVKGRNYHEMGEYRKAEYCYLNSIWLLPERIYPYYLLTKLYADSANYQPEKMFHAAKAVLEKEPKVHSMAINEMRNEVRKILKEKGVTYE
ncbi:MAG: O-antigen polymerase [Proteiniphilum acetatigenes]|uniref:O-antigen polymerase n=1 Tax=Proteiniphilum acetatigenes TaxID=294710 RepID=A0A101HL55_9BACT|nr:MAG: O-antigen polymerase [Proteiniphilum acetatigenes]